MKPLADASLGDESLLNLSNWFVIGREMVEMPDSTRPAPYCRIAHQQLARSIESTKNVPRGMKRTLTTRDDALLRSYQSSPPLTRGSCETRLSTLGSLASIASSPTSLSAAIDDVGVGDEEAPVLESATELKTDAAVEVDAIDADLDGVGKAEDPVGGSVPVAGECAPRDAVALLLVLANGEALAAFGWPFRITCSACMANRTS